MELAHGFLDPSAFPKRFIQKFVSVKFSARNSGAGMGSANFMGTWHFLVLSAGKPPVPVGFRVLGGRVGVFWSGGVEVPILFLWARGFF